MVPFSIGHKRDTSIFCHFPFHLLSKHCHSKCKCLTIWLFCTAHINGYVRSAAVLRFVAESFTPVKSAKSLDTSYVCDLLKIMYCPCWIHLKKDEFRFVETGSIGGPLRPLKKIQPQLLLYSSLKWFQFHSPSCYAKYGRWAMGQKAAVTIL